MFGRDLEHLHGHVIHVLALQALDPVVPIANGALFGPEGNLRWVNRGLSQLGRGALATASSKIFQIVAKYQAHSH